MAIFYVYMSNNTDHRDDEVYKVTAESKAEARDVADRKQTWPGRFSVGWVMPARPKSKRDKDFLRGYKRWATDMT